MGGKSSPPPAPNYMLGAQMSEDASKEAIEQQTWANRPNQVSPFGSVAWSATPEWDPSTQQFINQWTQQVNIPGGQYDENGNWTPGPNAEGTMAGALGLQQSMMYDQSDLANQLLQRQKGDPNDPNNPGLAKGIDWAQFDQLATPYARVQDIGYDPFAFDTPTGAADIKQYDQGMLNQLDPRQVYANRARQAQTGTGYDPNELRQQAEDAMYSQATSRLDPEWNQRQSDMEAQLAAQGLRPGDAAYDQQMQNFNRSRNDAYNQAKWSASEAGRAEANQLFGQGLNEATLFNQGNQQLFAQQQAANAAQQGLRGNMFNEQMAILEQNNAAPQLLQQMELARRGGNLQNQSALAVQQNQMRQNQLAEYMQRYGYDLNTIQALMQGQQVQMPNLPGFQTAQAYQPGDYMGAMQMQDQSAIDRYNAQQAQQQGLMSGLGSLGSAAASMYTAGMFPSDRRLKKNIKRIGTFRGYPWYSFDYIWGEPSMGVMADEINQDAVGYTPDGFAFVDYARIK
jgi:hypothetical protein